MNIFGQLLTTVATPRARSNVRAGVVTVDDLAAAEAPAKDRGPFVIVASLMGVVVLGATVAGVVAMQGDKRRNRN